MESAAALAVLATLGAKITDVVRYVRGQDWNSVAIQVVAWAVGIVLIFAASAANQFQNLVVPGLNVAIVNLDGASKVLVGTAFMSLLSKVVDLEHAFDNTQSAAKPALLAPKKGNV